MKVWAWLTKNCSLTHSPTFGLANSRDLVYQGWQHCLCQNFFITHSTTEKSHSYNNEHSRRVSPLCLIPSGDRPRLGLSLLTRTPLIGLRKNMNKNAREPFGQTTAPILVSKPACRDARCTVHACSPRGNETPFIVGMLIAFLVRQT